MIKIQEKRHHEISIFNLQGQDYSNSEDVINELEVDTVDGKKTAHLRHKPSLFSEDSEVCILH